MNITVIIGPQKCGKTLFARMISSGRKNACFINKMPGIRLKDPFLFSHCTHDTDLVVFDDLHIGLLADVLDYVRPGLLKVDARGKKSFLISPDIIIIIDADSENLDLVEFIKARQCNLISFQGAKFPLPKKVVDFICSE